MKKIFGLMLLVFIFTSCRQAPLQKSEINWKPYSKKAIEDSVTQHKPIVIDFFAEWCPNCHDLDREVFSRSDIQAKLAQVTTLRMDATNQDDPDVQKILQDYQVDGFPTVIFLDAHGHEIDNSRVIGFVSPEEFSQALALFRIFK